ASTPATLLLTSANDKTPSGMSSDGKTLLVNHASSLMKEVAAVTLSDHPTLQPLFKAEAGAVTDASLSPDGHWIGYSSSESGHAELLVRSYPDVNNSRHQVAGGNASPGFWTKGGHELIYNTGSDMMAVSFDPATGNAGRPVRLFTESDEMTGTFDVTPDGS